MLTIGITVQNKYDIFIFFLIISLIGGVYGGALTFSRVLTILLLPQLVLLHLRNQCPYTHVFIVFFVAWLLYGLLSFYWTSDVANCAKEFVHYIITFAYFLEIITFSRFANNPLKGLSLGWLCGFVFCSIIAMWELITDRHLSVSMIQSDSVYNMGYGLVFLRRFASVTFGNYNSYVTYICFSFPFILYALNYNKWRYVAVFSVIIAFVIVGANASRGGIISLIGMLFVYLLLSSSKKMFFWFIPILLWMFFYGKGFDLLFARMENLSDGRVEVWKNALSLWVSTAFIGSGMGSMVESMKCFQTIGVWMTHNLFLEILVQYGFVIFIPFVLFIILLVKDGLSLKDFDRRSVLLPCFLMMPVYSIINSSYLLNLYTAAFFATLYIFVYYERIKSFC